MKISHVTPHYIRLEESDELNAFTDNGGIIAAVHPASAGSIDMMLGRTPIEDGTESERSVWMWITLADGTAIFGCFPQAALYDATELDRQFPGEVKTPRWASRHAPEHAQFIDTVSVGDKIVDVYVIPATGNDNDGDQQYVVRWGTSLGDEAATKSYMLDGHAAISKVWAAARGAIHEWARS